MRNAHTIDAERQILCGKATIVANGKVQVELISFADQLARCAQDRALRIMHFDLQFAAVVLRPGWKRKKSETSEESDNLNESRHGGLENAAGSGDFALHENDLSKLRAGRSVSIS